MEGRLFRLKTALRTVRYRAEGCFGNRNEIVNCFVSDRQFLLSASYHKPYQPSTAFYGNSAPAGGMRNFYLHFLHTLLPLSFVFFCALAVHPAKIRPFPTFSSNHSARASREKNNFFSQEYSRYFYQYQKKIRTPLIKRRPGFYHFLQAVKNYLFLRLKKAFLPRNCATSSPSSSSMRSS